MKKTLYFLTIMILSFQVSYSQEKQIRVRSLNEVVFSLHNPLSEEQKLKKIPAELLHEDIDLFVSKIEEIGVNPYINISKESFYHEISLLKNRIDRPLTKREFLQLFVPVSNVLRLSHTYVLTGYNFDKADFAEKGGAFFPLDIKIVNNRLFIVKDYTLLNLAKGVEIIAINNITSEKIIDRLLRYPNISTFNSRLMAVQNNFSAWLWWVYNFADTFKVQTSNHVYNIKGLTSGELDNKRNENSVQYTDTDYRQYEYVQIDSETGKLVFRDFGIRDALAYNSFLDSTFLEIKNKAIQNLIVDVRGNPGGNHRSIEVVKYLFDTPFKADSKVYYKKSKTAEDFFRLLLYPEDKNNVAMQMYVNESCFGTCHAEHKHGESYECGEEIHSPKPDSLRFKGNLFVLSDYNTGSAAVGFVVLIKDYGIGTIIGSETNQSPSSDGNGVFFVLPNSNVMAMGANVYSIRPNGDPSTTRGVIPDYEITQDDSDTEKGIDTILEFTMKLLKNKN